MSGYECHIEIENKKPFYVSGDVIEGRLEISVTSPFDVTGIVVICKGKCKVRVRGSKNQTQTSTEQYFRDVISCYDGNGKSTKLSVGQHVYPFQFVIPPNIPSSFQGTLGYVRYMIRTKIKRSIKGKKFDHIFHVFDFRDPRTTPELMVPFNQTFKKNVYNVYLTKAGKIKYTISLERMAFTSGETIKITVEIENNSSVEITSTRFQLIEAITYSLKPPYKNTDIEWAPHICLRDGSVSPGETKIFQQFFQLPEGYIPPYDLPNCSFIDVKYYFQIKGKIPGMHISLRKLVPVYLGTAPPNQFLNLGPPADNGLTFDYNPPEYDEAVSSKGVTGEAIEKHLKHKS